AGRRSAAGGEVREPCPGAVEYHVGHYEEGPHALFGHRRECAVELVRTSSLQELKPHSQRPGRDVHFSYRELVIRIVRVREDGHMADLGDSLLEQLQLFGEDSRPAVPDTPVTFPPGRARLAMSPVPTGSRTKIMTRGIVSVAFLAAVAPCAPADATIRSTLSRTSSAARSGSRSTRPSA